MSSQNHQERRNRERSSGPTLCLRQNCSQSPKTEHQPMDFLKSPVRAAFHRILPPLASTPRLIPPPWFNPAWNLCSQHRTSLVHNQPFAKSIPHSIACLSGFYSTAPPPKKTYVGTSGSLHRISSLPVRRGPDPASHVEQELLRHIPSCWASSLC